MSNYTNFLILDTKSSVRPNKICILTIMNFPHTHTLDEDLQNIHEHPQMQQKGQLKISPNTLCTLLPLA